MQCGVIGLGRMGTNMARRRVRGGHEVVVSNRSPGPVKELEAEGAVDTGSHGELVERLKAPRGVWGLEIGYCLMIGGSRAAFERLELAFKTLAPPDGYPYTGPRGSGHSSRWCTIVGGRK